MVKPINLRQARKLADRQGKARQADENAAKFGRSKAQKTTEARAADKAARHLDQHQRQRDD